MKYSSEISSKQQKEKYESLDNESQNKAIMNPGHVDESKWKKAKDKSMEEYGEHKWPFVMYLYKEMGGK